MTIRNKYQLPKIVLKSGYHQLKVKKKDILKIVLWTVLSFSDANLVD